jgi:hypothetical protein
MLEYLEHRESPRTGHIPHRGLPAAVQPRQATTRLSLFVLLTGLRSRADRSAGEIEAQTV